MTSRCRPTVDCCEETVAAETNMRTHVSREWDAIPPPPAKCAIKVFKHESFWGEGGGGKVST